MLSAELGGEKGETYRFSLWGAANQRAAEAARLTDAAFCSRSSLRRWSWTLRGSVELFLPSSVETYFYAPINAYPGLCGIWG